MCKCLNWFFQNTSLFYEHKSEQICQNSVSLVNDNAEIITKNVPLHSWNDHIMLKENKEK